MDKHLKHLWIGVIVAHCLLLGLLSSGQVRSASRKKAAPIVVRTRQPPTLLNTITEQQPITTVSPTKPSEPRNLVRTINKNLHNTSKPQKAKKTPLFGCLYRRVG